MQQIADWLEKLGMSEYAQRFAENKIDVSVLRHLTDQDLKDIGVPLGHGKNARGRQRPRGTTPVTTEHRRRAEGPRHRRAPPGHGHVRCATSAPRSTPTARVIQSSAKWSRRRMRSQNVVSTQELLVGGSGGDLNRLPPRQARTPRVKPAPGIPAQLSVMARISEFLANTSTAPRLRRVCPPKS